MRAISPLPRINKFNASQENLTLYAVNLCYNYAFLKFTHYQSM